MPFPFNVDFVRKMLRQRIIVPVGPARDGSELMCSFLHRIKWKQFTLDELASMIYFLTNVLSQRYVLFWCVLVLQSAHMYT